MKLYILAEAKTGYVSNFEVYSGVGKIIIETVNKLVSPFKHMNYRLYMDNFYNSVKLTENLLLDQIYSCGTFHMNRDAPKEFRDEVKKMKKDKVIFRRKDDTFIICWKDKRLVSMISNCHNSDTGVVERIEKTIKDGKREYKKVAVNKPLAVIDYNKYMSGVDHFDQMIKYYKFARKTKKWSKKLIMYLLQMSIHNSYVLYKNHTSDSKIMDLLDFHEMIYSLLMNFNPDEWQPSGYFIETASNNDLVEEQSSRINESLPPKK